MKTIMNTVRSIARTFCRLAWSGLPLVMLHSVNAEIAPFVAVSSRVSADYVRTKTPAGVFEPEAFAFGEGGVWGGKMADASADKLNFKNVARTLAPVLRAQNYLPARDPAKTKLLIMVYWGMTAGTSGASSSVAYQNLSSANQQLNLASDKLKVALVNDRLSGTNDKFSAASEKDEADAIFAAAMTLADMENRERDRADLDNAGILGYDEALYETRGRERTALGGLRKDLIDELEDNRYFVVLMAYDFQLLNQEKKHKLLWETRFSIRERGNAFDRQLAEMSEAAARYFGQTTNGLRRHSLPTEHVRLDEMKILGEVPSS